MSGPILILAFTALVVAVAAWTGRPRRVFVLRVTAGRARLESGTAPEAFVADVEAICHLWKVGEGEVRGYRQGTRVTRIRVRGEIASCAQAVRNAWRHPID